MSIAIDKCVPVPAPRHCKNRNEFPFSQMEIGDSFLFDCDLAGENRLRSNALYFAKKNPGFTFCIRKCDGGYRLWRIAGKEAK